MEMARGSIREWEGATDVAHDGLCEKMSLWRGSDSLGQS